MIGEAQITVRNVGLLLAQRGFLIIGSFLFAATVPRMMAPDNYGRYALVTSFAICFALFSDLGLTQVMGRFVPRFMLQDDRENLKKLFSNLLTASVTSGLLSSGFYLFITSHWLGDLDGLLLAVMAITVFVRTWADPFFALFLGLNRAARWGLGEILRRWVSIFFLIPGFYLGGLRGACLGLLLTELVVMIVGGSWGRSYLSWSEMRLDIRYLTPYLRFGLIFSIINLLHTMFQRSGELLVRFFCGDYVQVGYFGLAYGVYITIALAIPQFTLAFAPLMTTLHTQGETESLKQWVEHLLKWLAVGGTLTVFCVLLLGNDLVPLVLGNAYQSVAINLLPLSMTLLLQALSSVATLLTLIYNRPLVALMTSAIRLITFWGVGVPLVAKWGSLGGCLAVLVAMALSAGYFTWRMQVVMSYSLKRWALAIGLGSLFFPLVWLRCSWMVNLTLYGIFVAGYFGMLILLRVIALDEVAGLWRAIS
jgi:O-antigen/teichoic acid export membrane protein